MNKPLFQIVFVDGSTFDGGDFQNTKWIEIPKKKIRSLFYQLPSGDYLGMGGYDRFYHFVECTEDLNGDRAGIKNIEFTYIIGQKKESTSVYKINWAEIANDKCIDLKIMKNDDKFLKRFNQDGWK